MTANSVQKDPSDQIASPNKPTTNPGHGTNVTNSGVVLDPQGCRTLYLSERNWEIGVRGPLYVVLLVVFFYLV